MENQTNIFANKESSDGAQSSRGLYKTAELTQLSSTIAKAALKEMLSDESYRELILASQKTNDAMDELLQMVVEFDTEYSFLSETPADEIDKMLKSQQSKRSRLKSKAMTLENYTNLLTAGVAENVLRIAGGIPKGAYNGSRKLNVEYSNEELEELAKDQDALGKAIRNVQSKKCIAKGKANFDAQSEDYQAILATEAVLKQLRNTQNAVLNESVAKVKDLLTDVEDFSNMSEEEAKQLLQRISQSIVSK